MTDLKKSLEQELDAFMEANPGANRGAVAATLSAERGLPFNDPKEIQNDGEPIADAVKRISIASYADAVKHGRPKVSSPLITASERADLDRQRRDIYDAEKAIVERRMGALYDLLEGWPVDIQNAFIDGEWHVVVPWLLNMGVNRAQLAAALHKITPLKDEHDNA